MQSPLEDKPFLKSPADILLRFSRTNPVKIFFVTRDQNGKHTAFTMPKRSYTINRVDNDAVNISVIYYQRVLYAEESFKISMIILPNSEY